MSFLSKDIGIDLGTANTLVYMKGKGIIMRAYAKTGKPVVVLIDEYDAPLLGSNSDALLQQQLRNEICKFFSPLKGLGQYLRFLFITGISKFSQQSIFSRLNNLQR